ncbi:MAG: hypothetical protein JOZ10_08605 [Acidobacteria bacterium]|nr:hypothetical protein [Acidobacteriota bacterium]MBV9146373.1 hypothetical protein [Acidobacteriota bacterium]MBV9436620.1 hypothetical protein [Acidobacteriota bacterium]
MKIGAENKKELYAMITLMIIAAGALLYWISSPSTPTPGAAAPKDNANAALAQPEAANRTGRSRGKSGPPLDPTLRTDLLRNSEEAEYKGSGRNIFEAQAEIPKPIKSPVVPQPKPQPAPEVASGPPAPPPIPLKFYGFANRPGQPKSIFLANGDDIFVGKEGDIVSRRYKIIHITPTQVEIEDVQNNHREAIPLTAGSA